MADENNTLPLGTPMQVDSSNVAPAPEFFDAGVNEFLSRFKLGPDSSHGRETDALTGNTPPAAAPATAPAPVAAAPAPAPAPNNDFQTAFQSTQQQIAYERQQREAADRYKATERAKILAQIPLADPNDSNSVGFAPQMREKMADLLLQRQIEVQQTAVQSTGTMMQQFAPQIQQYVQQQVQAALAGQQAQQGFFGSYPSLNRPEYAPAIQEAAVMAQKFARQGEDPSAMYARVARLTSELLGLDPSSVSAQAPVAAPNFAPARAGSGAGTMPSFGRPQAPPQSDIGAVFDILRSTH